MHHCRKFMQIRFQKGASTSMHKCLVGCLTLPDKNIHLWYWQDQGIHRRNIYNTKSYDSLGWRRGSLIITSSSAASLPPWNQKERGNTLRIYQNLIFHHTAIKISFEMLKSSEHKKLWRGQIINSPILKIILKLDQLIPQFNFTIKF